MTAITANNQIRPLGYPDLHYLRAAEGWLDLDNHLEANRELGQISRARRGHPHVLLLRWHVSARNRDWESCLLLARSVTTKFPDDYRGWKALAQSFYHLDNVARAYDISSTKVAVFPESWKLIYDTACYACLLGMREEAQFYFKLAMVVGDAKAIKRRARKDKDLQNLWKHSG